MFIIISRNENISRDSRIIIGYREMVKSVTCIPLYEHK